MATSSPRCTPLRLPVDTPAPDSYSLPATSLLATNAIDNKMAMPYMHQFVTNVQWSVRKNTLLEVGYVGSKGVKLPTQVYLNQARLASTTNPVNGVTTNTANN